jgi:hypothetical protein
LELYGLHLLHNFIYIYYSFTSSFETNIQNIECDVSEDIITNAKNIIALKILREQRNNKLRDSDIYTLSDFPHKSEEIKQLWLTYRKNLRDLPSTYSSVTIDTSTGELIDVIWPPPPPQ